MNGGWIGVDLDGTLAQYDGWKGIEHIGEPVPLMVERVRGWLSEGKEVKIFTARVAGHPDAVVPIYAWCKKHLGRALPVTYMKDMNMLELWDDRAVQVIPNTGERADGRL